MLTISPPPADIKSEIDERTERAQYIAEQRLRLEQQDPERTAREHMARMHVRIAREWHKSPAPSLEDLSDEELCFVAATFRDKEALAIASERLRKRLRQRAERLRAEAEKILQDPSSHPPDVLRRAKKVAAVDSDRPILDFDFIDLRSALFEGGPGKVPKCFGQLAMEILAYPERRKTREGARERAGYSITIAKLVKWISDLGFPIHTPFEHRDHDSNYLSACRIIAQEVCEGEAWVEKTWLKYRGVVEWVNEDG